MTTWHKFPDEKPKVEGRYLLTIPSEFEDEGSIVIVAYWDNKRFLMGSSEAPIAWADIPAPYDVNNTDELKPNVVYPREVFDGNPNGYPVVDMYRGGATPCFYGMNKKDIHSLLEGSSHFMYLDKPDTESNK